MIFRNNNIGFIRGTETNLITITNFYVDNAIFISKFSLFKVNLDFELQCIFLCFLRLECDEYDLLHLGHCKNNLINNYKNFTI